MKEKFYGWDKIDASSVSVEETEQAFQEVMERARTLEDYLGSERRRKHRIWKRAALSIAAMLAFVAIPWSAFRYARQSVPESESVQYVQRTAQRGESVEVILPDNSRVVLNSESVLIYPVKFGKERSVFLTGEAIFDVTASQEKPFLVQTSGLTVKVFGTRFNVSAYFDDPVVTATLNRGLISAWPVGEPERRVDLQPDQQVAFNRTTGDLKKEKVNSVEVLSWEGGYLCFRSQSIQETIKVIQRHFGVQIYLTNSRYEQAKISARFVHGETVDELMDAFCMIVPGMKYTRSGDVIYLE